MLKCSIWMEVVFIMLSRTIDAWIDVEASPERIWEVLVDFSKWRIWNSFIPLVKVNYKKAIH